MFGDKQWGIVASQNSHHTWDERAARECSLKTRKMEVKGEEECPGSNSEHHWRATARCSQQREQLITRPKISFSSHCVNLSLAPPTSQSMQRPCPFPLAWKAFYSWDIWPKGFYQRTMIGSNALKMSREADVHHNSLNCNWWKVVNKYTVPQAPTPTAS